MRILNDVMHALFKSRSRKVEDELESIWRGSHDIRRDFELIRLYHDYRKSEHAEIVDNKTWSDLEMDEVFARIDRTTSSIGRQYLYATLRTYENDIAELERRDRSAALFRKDKTLRRAIQKELYRLRDKDVLYLVRLFFEDLPRKPKFAGLVYASSALFFLSIPLIPFHVGFLLATTGIALVNLVISGFYGRVVLEHFEPFSHLTKMLSTVQSLGCVVTDESLKELELLKSHSCLAARLNRKISWLCVDESRLNELAGAFLLFLNLFGLLKLVVFLISLDDLKLFRREIREMYEAIGALDAHISVASYLKSTAISTTPSFDGATGMNVTGIYHPLVDNAVRNSFALGGGAALITGSNLAGKTTFIKTIGINLILARTLFFCLAEKAILPRLIVRSSINHDERVVDGHSYYSREVEEIHDFLDCSPGRFLFLIDEIFRGTNTVERIAIAASTIRYLAQRNILLVTTHDVELQSLLAECTRMFHFSEQVGGQRYYFDYVLRPGPCREGNAIRLVELKGFPPEVVYSSRALASHAVIGGTA